VNILFSDAFVYKEVFFLVTFCFNDGFSDKSLLLGTLQA